MQQFWCTQPRPPSSLPSKWLNRKDQEINVAYVAITRSSKELLFLKHIKQLSDNPLRIVELFGEDRGHE